MAGIKDVMAGMMKKGTLAPYRKKSKKKTAAKKGKPFARRGSDSDYA